MPRTFEDFAPGFRHDYRVPGLSAEEIVAFARRYDPQAFHLDPRAAADTHFGGLVASGFQTQLECFAPFCREVLADAHGIGAPGIDELRWLRPWYPGEDLDVRVEVADSRLSTTRRDRGYLDFELRAAHAGHSTLAMRWTTILLTREGLA